MFVYRYTNVNILFSYFGTLVTVWIFYCMSIHSFTSIIRKQLWFYIHILRDKTVLSFQEINYKSLAILMMIVGCNLLWYGCMRCSTFNKFYRFNKNVYFKNIMCMTLSGFRTKVFRHSLHNNKKIYVHCQLKYAWVSQYVCFTRLSVEQSLGKWNTYITF